ncbi:MAG: hypothetical protein D6681_06370 [Calditrichaeota bacterium]|nr:MAG: hypothetical protein D6681_06370 [Calditrichota bacterium]
MDRIWIATASLLYPETSPGRLVSLDEILAEIDRLFPTEITRVMVTHHLVSWVDRQKDRANPSRGGSRNRYLFRTLDGVTPSGTGKFRLYRAGDARYDGQGKTGKTHPQEEDVPAAYRYLLKWYQEEYYQG